MPNSNIQSRLYVELDGLLDTVLGTLMTIDADKALALGLTDAYQCREEDVFDGFDTAVFKERYKNRDNIVLQHSVVSNMLRLLQHHVYKLKLNNGMEDNETHIEIIINVYPYTVSEEIKKGICQIITNQLLNTASVRVVSMTPLQVSPSWVVAEDIGLLAIYNFNDWLNLHYTHDVANDPELRFLKQPLLKDVYLYGPRLFFNGKPDQAILDAEIKNIGHPATCLEAEAQPIIGLRLLPVTFFSLFDPSFSDRLASLKNSGMFAS